jgi:SAM-dependent methyltransferase
VRRRPTSRDRHGAHDASPWVVRFASLIPPGGQVLDVASGTGRHTRWFLDRGYDVVAVDRDVSGLDDIGEHDRLEMVEVDLEDGEPFPLRNRRFAGVVVTNYLYRPILDQLVSAVASGGALIYETFSAGNERFGRPTRPEFLLRPGELLDVVRGELRVVAFEDLVVDQPRPAAVQRIAAVRDPETGR